MGFSVDTSHPGVADFLGHFMCPETNTVVINPISCSCRCGEGDPGPCNRPIEGALIPLINASLYKDPEIPVDETHPCICPRCYQPITSITPLSKTAETIKDFVNRNHFAFLANDQSVSDFDGLKGKITESFQTLINHILEHNSIEDLRGLIDVLKGDNSDELAQLLEKTIPMKEKMLTEAGKEELERSKEEEKKNRREAIQACQKARDTTRKSMARQSALQEEKAKHLQTLENRQHPLVRHTLTATREALNFMAFYQVYQVAIILYTFVLGFFSG